MTGRARDFRCIKPQHECLNRPRDVLQIQRPDRLECKIEPIVHVITHGSRDTDTTRRTFALQPRHDVDRAAMEVGALGDHVADIDGDTKADGPIGGLVAIIVRHLPLYFHGALHGAVNAVEHDE